MSIHTSQRLESDVQTTFGAFEGQDNPTLSIGDVYASGAETSVDHRGSRAMTEFLHAMPTSATEYLVESGSGPRYFVDLYNPDESEYIVWEVDDER